MRMWARVEPLLPFEPRGAHRVDDRRVASRIVHVDLAKSPARSRDRVSMRIGWPPLTVVDLIPHHMSAANRQAQMLVHISTSMAIAFCRLASAEKCVNYKRPEWAVSLLRRRMSLARRRNRRCDSALLAGRPESHQKERTE